MNFVAHALVASHASDDPRFGLGAMLPDLAAMASLRLPASVPHAEVARGVAHHHLVDGWFHEHATFARLTARARGLAEGAGLGRGAARAAAHVGVELLLDACAYELPRARGAYDAALGVASTIDGARELGLAPGDAARLAWMLPQLVAGRLPARYRDARFVAERLVGMTRGRPRIEIAPASAPRLTVALAALEADVRAAAPELLDGPRPAG